MYLPAILFLNNHFICLKKHVFFARPEICQQVTIAEREDAVSMSDTPQVPLFIGNNLNHDPAAT
jgi:hypothetical protein